MNDLDVRFVDLEPMRVVSALGFGGQPENEAWKLILDYVEGRGLDPRAGRHRFFGFNNPNPSAGSPNYGYEQWITVGPGVGADPPLETKEFRGGRYAVTRCESLDRMEATWQAFAVWLEDAGLSPAPGREPCLEELLSPVDEPQDEWVFDLYVAVADDE